MDKIFNDARVYTDTQGLEQLRGHLKTNPQAVKTEMAKQFEAIMLQMVMRSMRDANQVFSSDLFSGNEMGMYQDMFDKQLTLNLSSQGTGLAKLIEENIDHQMGIQPTNIPTGISDHPLSSLTTTSHAAVPAPMDEYQEPEIAPFTGAPITASIKPSTRDIEDEIDDDIVNDVRDHTDQNKPANSMFHSSKDFMQAIWAEAKQAAAVIGVPPSVLLAQAALETDWGKKIIQHGSGQSSHNLFNIKADADWKKATTTTATLEQKGDVLVKEHAHFRSYASFKESFMDYVGLIKNSPRYKKAVENAHDPAQYSQALQEAGYASDKKYANKIMGIMESSHFQSLLGELK